jgi:ankyrin repeat protein
MMKSMFNNVAQYFKSILYLFVLIGVSFSHAGSYDDFFVALIQDDPSKIKALLNRGFDPNTVDSNGLPGLIFAIRADAFSAATALVDWPNTKVDVRNAMDESPLMLAALKGELALCQALIKRGGNVNKPGWAPLHYAATNGHLDVMRLLLDAYAYIDAASPNGTTPLMMAAQYGSDDAVGLLLEEGADPTIKNDLSLTAIDFANRADRPATAKIIAAAIRARQPKGTW